jgi:hypothetical protein
LQPGQHLTDVRVSAARIHELNYCFADKAPEVGVIQKGASIECVELRFRQTDPDLFNDLVAVQDPFQWLVCDSSELLQGLSPRVFDPAGEELLQVAL